MNAPHPAEHFTLAEGEKKVIFTPDTKLADAGTFLVNKEDHTIGNIIRMSLLSDRRVLFAGYRQPHPLDPFLHIKVKTRGSNSNSNASPITVMIDSLHNLHTEIADIQQQWEVLIQHRGMDQSRDINIHTQHMENM